jgi:hypothetical protein
VPGDDRALWPVERASLIPWAIALPSQERRALDASRLDRPKCGTLIWRKQMEQTGQCHCGSLRVIATGEPERVYLCHCEACQRRTGTAFHFGASFPKERVRLDGERKIFERDADSGYRIRFHFCPNCGSTVYWEGDRNPAVCGVAVGAFDASAFPPPRDSIWEESMHSWLGLPPRMDHHRQGRPPAS